MAPFFEVENLTKRFGGLVAVNEVSFKVERDETGFRRSQT